MELHLLFFKSFNRFTCLHIQSFLFTVLILCGHNFSLVASSSSYLLIRLLRDRLEIVINMEAAVIETELTSHNFSFP